jgi:hypothetical protein
MCGQQWYVDQIFSYLIPMKFKFMNSKVNYMNCHIPYFIFSIDSKILNMYLMI